MITPIFVEIILSTRAKPAIYYTVEYFYKVVSAPAYIEPVSHRCQYTE